MRAALLVVVLALSGCATPFKRAPTAEQLADAEARDLYGAPPADVDASVRAHLRVALFDPYSVQDVSVGSAERAWYFRAGGLLRNEDLWFGWRAPVTYNAKNRYGAYTGIRRQFAYLRGDVVQFMD